MRAPTKLVNDLCSLSALDPPSAGPGGRSPMAPERRRYGRVKLHKAATITELDSAGNAGDSWECRMVDLSRGGVGLRSRRMIHAGRFVFVMVRMGPDRPRKLLCGVVRQSRYAMGEGFALGVHFKSPPQTETVKAWLSQHGFAASLAAEAQMG